jgi:hypothetical protein
VVRYETVRMMIVLAALKDWHIVTRQRLVLLDESFCCKAPLFGSDLSGGSSVIVSWKDMTTGLVLQRRLSVIQVWIRRGLVLRAQGMKSPCKFFCGRRLPKTESEWKCSRGCQITLYEYKKLILRSDVYNYWGLYTGGTRIGTQLILRRHNDVIVMS